MAQPGMGYIKAACIPGLWAAYNLPYRPWIGVTGQALSLLANLLFVTTHQRSPSLQEKPEGSKVIQKPLLFKGQPFPKETAVTGRRFLFSVYMHDFFKITVYKMVKV